MAPPAGWPAGGLCCRLGKHSSIVGAVVGRGARGGLATSPNGQWIQSIASPLAVHKRAMVEMPLPAAPWVRA